MLARVERCIAEGVFPATTDAEVALRLLCGAGHRHRRASPVATACRPTWMRMRSCAMPSRRRLRAFAPALRIRRRRRRDAPPNAGNSLRALVGSALALVVGATPPGCRVPRKGEAARYSE